MALNLSKGTELNLTKSAAGMTKFKVKLSWGQGADLDVSALPLNKEGKIVMPMVWYQNLTIEGVTHTGDQRDGGFEEIVFETDKLKADRYLIAVSSHSQVGNARGEPVVFGAAQTPKAELQDQNGTTLVEVNLNSDAALSTAIEFVELYKNDSGEWIYKNITNPLGRDAFGIAELLNKYPQA